MPEKQSNVRKREKQRWNVEADWQSPVTNRESIRDEYEIPQMREEGRIG
jgi:hypothetical protein